MGDQYNGFNLIAGDHRVLFYYSNRGNGVKKIGPGIFGLSNHLLDTPWPKVERGKAGLIRVIGNEKFVNPEPLFQLMADRSFPPDGQLPDTGVGLEKERMLSPLFITSPDYGTRCSSIFLWENGNEINVWERLGVSIGCVTQIGDP